MNYNRAKFFSAVRKTFGALSQDQVDGFNYLLAAWEREYPKGDVRYLAYALATTWHETDSSMEPIVEYGKGKGKKYGPTGFYGRGYVQLTWDYNYIKASKKLKELYGINVDLYKDPELALVPEYAVLILYAGMIEGWFTGRKLSQFFNDKTDDPEEARRIINGVDKKAKIAGYHRSFLSALRDSQEAVQAPSPVPAPTPAPKAPEPVTPAPEAPVAVKEPSLLGTLVIAFGMWLKGRL